MISLENDATVTPSRTLSSPRVLVVSTITWCTSHLSSHWLRARVRLRLQVVLRVVARWRGTAARMRCVPLFHFNAGVRKPQPRLADQLRCPVTLKPLVQMALTYLRLFCKDANGPLTGVMCSVWMSLLRSLWVYISADCAACSPGGGCIQPCVSSCQLCYSYYYKTDFN